MKKLLITGFEPFGGETINPSWDAILRLPSEIGGYALIKRLIPVEFGKAAESVIRTAEEMRPDVILCVGQAGGRDAITPEMVGINLRHASMPDNSGLRPQDEPIVVGGDTAYFSTLPVRSMAKAMCDAGLPARVSYSAGTYVCNDLLYTLLAHFHGSEARVGFIHVPYCTEQGKEPAMTIDDIVKGLAVAIQNIG
jgi:pyroglutamyl-peptidase